MEGRGRRKHVQARNGGKKRRGGREGRSGLRSAVMCKFSNTVYLLHAYLSEEGDVKERSVRIDKLEAKQFDDQGVFVRCLSAMVF